MRFPWLVVLLGASLVLTASASVKPAKRPAVPVTAEIFLARNAHQRGVIQTASGLQYRVLRAGTGTAQPSATDVALINYTGTLTNGTVFDRSARPTPLPVDGVVPGFSEALRAMRKGARYRVWIKPSLGYGDRAAGPIPPGSVLIFDIELLDFISADAFRQIQSGQTAAPPVGN